MAKNNAINSGALGAGFLYTDGSGNISSTSGFITTQFLSSGTWNKNSKTTSITVFIWNGGGGGGSGAQGLTAAASGGAGGGQGGFIVYSGPASLFNSSETVTVGAGGLGGTTQSSATSAGNNGGFAGVSSFGNISVTDCLYGNPARGGGTGAG